MGSEFGYKYDYTFSMMNADEIQPNHKYLLQFDKYKTFLFDITTNFQLIRAETDENERVLLDSERFHFSFSEGLCRPENFPGAKSTPEEISMIPFLSKIEFRLREYWMTRTEILTFSRAALDFVKRMSASPEHFYSDLIPVAVSFRVCTLQEVGEPYESAKDRAICSKKLIPLYSWGYPSLIKAADDECYKAMSDELKNDLIRLTRERNDVRLMDADWVCYFCSKGQSVGDQISRLGCDHSFHSRCVFRWLEDHNACPECGYEFGAVF